jgi:hypothetical protein
MSARNAEEDFKMVWQRFVVTAFTILALAPAGALPTHAQEGSNRLDTLARKLNLTDKQKKEVGQIYADFDRKANPLLKQLCTQRDEEWQALQNALNEAQRTKLKEAIKTQAAKELQNIARELNLSEEQTKQVERIRTTFWTKFLNICMQKDENMAREYREVSMEATLAGRQLLTPEQRAKLTAVQRKDFNDWHDFIFQHEHLKALGQQLGLSEAKLKQLQQVCASHEQKLEQPRAQLKELCKDGCANLNKVLNAQQQASFHEVFPFHFLQGE